jgi:hypothetical protein
MTAGDGPSLSTCGLAEVGRDCSATVTGISVSDGLWLLSPHEGHPLAAPIMQSIPPTSVRFTPIDVGWVRVRAVVFSPVFTVLSTQVQVTERSRWRMALPHGGWIEYPTWVRQGELTYFSVYLTTEDTDRNVRIKSDAPQRCFLGICFSYFNYDPRLVSCGWPPNEVCLRQIMVSVAWDTPLGTYTIYGDDRQCPGICSRFPWEPWDPFEFQITVVK